MCPISGGNWNNTSNAGVWALNFNNSRGNSNNNVGFRSDSESPRIQQWNGGTKGDFFRRAAKTSAAAKSDGIRLSGRAGNRIEGQAR
jgi:hypothetical protein